MSKIVIVVSVDWEGRSLLEENLQSMARFRREHPDVPMQHFLNAAYYTRPGIDAAATTAAIQRVLLPEDEHGLHLHAWSSLVSLANVPVRTAPRFFEGELPAGRAVDDWEFYPAEAGYDVPLEQFAVGELDRLLQASRTILTRQGFRRAVSFRAGGWMAGHRVQTALAQNEFMFDCSAVDPGFVRRRFGDIALSRWLTELWPETTDTSQPYRLLTQAGDLWEVPNNAGLVDYTSAQELVEIFERNVARWKDGPDRHHIFSTGFHQETARKILDRLDEAISSIRRIADRQGLPLVFAAGPQEVLSSVG